MVRRARENSGNHSTAHALNGCRSFASSKTTATRSRSRWKGRTAGGDISKLVASFPGLFVQSIDGTDFLASYRAMSDAVAYARADKGPALVHARVTRPYSHSLSDDEKLYKTAEERAAEARRDPIARLASFLKTEGLATEADLVGLAQEIDAEVNAAAEHAKKADKPAPETATLYVYSPDIDPISEAFDTPPAPSGKPDTMVAAINRTLKDEMARDPRIVLFGEDVARLQPGVRARSGAGKGRRLQSYAWPAAGVRQCPRIQFAAGGGQHRRPRDWHGDARLEAGG